MNNIKLKNFYVNPQLPDGLNRLLELARNLWSSWDPEAFRLFNRIDPILFRKYDHNPLKMLQKINEERLIELSQNSGFISELNAVYHKFQTYLQFEGSYQENNENKTYDRDFSIAYFSMEYGIHESLPIYSGGLGVLSGDHLKAASDLGIPLIAFGLLYRYGYFKQSIDLNGKQKEIYTENEWYSKPIEKVKDEDGKDLQIAIDLKQERIYLKVWKTQVGKVPLYLFDSNLEQNKPQHRHITDYLYVADRSIRILQEIILAYGGLALIGRLNLNITVFHLNEGHSAFLIIQRLKTLINDFNFGFEEAKGFIRSTTVFTTHTPVPAGNEEFDLALIKTFLEEDITACKISFDEFVKFAQISDSSNFSLSALAIRFARYINGVSKLHSKVSREMWQPIYPSLFEDEIPIKSITNGVHVQSWISRQFARLFDRYLGVDYQHQSDNKDTWKNVHSIPDVEIWQAHKQRKNQLISFVRRRLQNTLFYRGVSANKVSTVLNPDHLIVGFARRFASYKRGSLILYDEERLYQLITHAQRPIQFIFAGKSHPADDKGKEVIKSLIDFARNRGLENSFVFLEDYDINIARHLVQGVDVWLNNPIRTLEASGTSGMKAGMNGVLNFSIPDGWWPECYNPSNGWSINAGIDINEPEVRDALEANEIYDLLENTISKIFYDQDSNGLPKKWIEMMKNSIHDVGSGFNMHRVLKDYLHNFYLPSYQNYQLLVKDNYQAIREMVKIKDQIKKYWKSVSFQKVEMNLYPDDQIDSGRDLDILAEIAIDGAPEDLFMVELFYRKADSRWQLIPLQFKDKNGDRAVFTLKSKISGSGKQGINLRIRPKPLPYCNFEDYVKWYY